MKLKFLTIFLLLTLIQGCELSGDLITGYIAYEATIPTENAQIKAYFCQNTSCSQKFVNIINNAKEFVYCAIYDLEEESIIDAINNATVEVKVVLEEKNYIELEQNTRPDTNSALMHNKFCVTDKEIITGSFNPTENGEHYNDNNIIVSNSYYLRKNYIKEFNELYEDIDRLTPHKKIIINNTNVENLFCPEDNCEDRVVELLTQSKSSIKFMTFSFTSDQIGDIIATKAEDGFEVYGIFEKRGYNSRYGEMEKIASAGGLVIFDNNPKTMHHKVFIIDDEIVITGSYNPTNNGNKNNDENVLIIHDTKIAKQYVNEFNRIYNN